MVTEQKAKEDILHGFKIYNTRDMGVIDRWYDELLAPDCVYHNPGVGDLEPGRESIKQFVHQLYKAMPDFYHNAPEDLIVQGDKVAVRYSVRRTDLPTGKPQTCMILLIEHYAGDQIAEMWELVGPWEDEV